MAKIARVGYGSEGQGVGKNPKGYAYLVNDNVRVGDRIQVVATSVKGNKFGTTAVPLSTHGENTVKGKEAKIDALTSGDKQIAGELRRQIAPDQLNKMAQGAVTQSYTGKELGLERRGMTELGYTQAVRGGNLKQNKVAEDKMTSKAQESFDSYSAKFMNKGEQQ